MSVWSLIARASSRFALFVSLLALSGFVSGRAFGAGTLQSLSASPNPALPGQPVTFKVAGTGGGCLALLVFGDGQQQAITIKGFPGTATHAYPAAGTFTPRVTGKPLAAGDPPSAFRPCGGSAELRLVVAAKPGSPAGGPPPTRTPPPPTRTPTPSVTAPPGGGTPGGAAPGALALAGTAPRALGPTATPTPATAVRALARPTATPNPMLNPGGDTMFSQSAFESIANPHLDRITDGSQATPGGVIGVEGSGFGTWIPNRRLVLKTGGKEVDLQITNWGDKAAAGTVPGSFGGVFDGPATVRLVNGIKKASNELSIGFVAARQTLEVGAGRIRVLGCSDDMSGGSCNAVNGPQGSSVGLDDLPSVERWMTCDSFDPFHSGHDNGDLYEARVSNGWVITDVKIDLPSDNRNGLMVCCNTLQLKEFDINGKGTAAATIKVRWHLTNFTAARYELHVLATGPAGVSPF